MSTKPTDSDTTTDDRTDTQLTRRAVLGALATGGGAAALTALGDADAPGPERTGLGGNSRESSGAAYRHGGWGFAPTTRPHADTDQLAWVRVDDPGHMTLGYASSPTQWQASGLSWSIAADLQTARNNLSGRPGVIASTAGAVHLVVDSVPTSWTAEGVEFVVESDLASAKQRWSGATPAVLWSETGAHVVEVAD